MNGWTNYHCHTCFVDPDVEREMTPAYYAGQLGERMRRAVLLNHGYNYYVMPSRPEWAADEVADKVREAGINVCSGGIIGIGESIDDRCEMLRTLANLEPQPESVPINQLVQVEGTPLAGVDALDPLEFVRTIAVARLCMPKSFVRLSAGRQQMSDAVQALCFLAGANSIFYGEKLLTTGNPEWERDQRLFDSLVLTAL